MPADVLEVVASQVAVAVLTHGFNADVEDAGPVDPADKTHQARVHHANDSRTGRLRSTASIALERAEVR